MAIRNGHAPLPFLSENIGRGCVVRSDCCPWLVSKPERTPSAKISWVAQGCNCLPQLSGYRRRGLELPRCRFGSVMIKARGSESKQSSVVPNAPAGEEHVWAMGSTSHPLEPKGHSPAALYAMLVNRPFHGTMFQRGEYKYFRTGTVFSKRNFSGIMRY